MLQALEKVKIILERLSFSLKCIIILGQEEPLSEKASYNKLTIGIVGYKYEPRVNSFSLAFEECKFNKMIRETR